MWQIVAFAVFSDQSSALAAKAALNVSLSKFQTSLCRLFGGLIFQFFACATSYLLGFLILLATLPRKRLQLQLFPIFFQWTAFVIAKLVKRLMQGFFTTKLHDWLDSGFAYFVYNSVWLCFVTVEFLSELRLVDIVSILLSLVVNMPSLSATFC